MKQFKETRIENKIWVGICFVLTLFLFMYLHVEGYLKHFFDAFK